MYDQATKTARRKNQGPPVAAQAHQAPRRSQGIKGGADWRAAILAITIAGLIGISADKPPPSRLVQTDYCTVTRRVAVKHPVTGQWIYGWGESYGPCSAQDIYRHI